MDSLSSSEIAIRRMISVDAMVAMPPSLYIVSNDVDVSDVVSFTLVRNCLSIFVILYLLLGCFRFVFVSDRYATSTFVRNMLSFIYSSINTSLYISSPSTFWNMRRNVYNVFLCTSSRKVRFWVIYGFVRCYNWSENTVYEFIGDWEGVAVGLDFCFVEDWVENWCDDIFWFGVLSFWFYDVYALDEMLGLHLLGSWSIISLCLRVYWVIMNSNWKRGSVEICVYCVV